MSSGPVPIPTPETAPFWEATARGELIVQRCRDCNTWFFYPRLFCPRTHCFSANVGWERVSGKATLTSYVLNHRPLPVFELSTPQIIAIVTLEEGPRMMTNVVGVEPRPDQLPIGLPLQVTFDPRGDQFLPVFRPANDGASE